MKNKRVTAYLCAGVLLVMTAGCGKSDEYLEVPKVDVVKVDNVTDTGIGENDAENVNNQQNSDEESISQSSSEESTDNQAGNSVEDGSEQQSDNKDLGQQPDNTQIQSDFELDGDIESIGDNSVVINQVFHPSDNASVSYGNIEEKTLVTVYFSEETQFEVWTTKNGGVNGDADTEKRQGTFSDLKQNTYISMTGSYSGNDSHAKQVIIHYYI